MQKTRVLIGLVVALWVFLSGVSYAADRALIIGIGSYAESKNDLPGLEPSLKIISQIVQEQLGFTADQIRVITNAQATSAGIQANISEWLIGGTSSSDRAFLYYFGHGTQVQDDNGDEPDGCDETFYTYEGGFLRDDTMTRLVEAIPAKELMLLLDSCFSGGAYRGLLQNNKEAFPMTLTSLGVVCGKASNLGERPTDNISPIDQREGRTIGLTAAGENEVGYSSETGSWLTRSLLGALQSSKDQVSFLQLRDLMATAMREYAGQRYVAPVPQVFGPTKWLSKSFQSLGRFEAVASPPPYNGEPNAAVSTDDLLNRVLNRSAFRVEVRTSKTSLRVGEQIVIDVKSSKAGYLQLFDLGPDGNLVLLFPNKFSQQNQISADEIISLPSPRVGNFRIAASEPVGRSRVLALVTTYSLNLYEATIGDLLAQFKVFAGQDAGNVGRSLTSLPDTAPNSNPSTYASDSKQHGAGQALIDVVK